MDAPTYEHFRAAVRGMRVTHAPFTHGYAESLFPAQYYRELLENLPAPACYRAAPSEYRRGSSASVRRHDFWLVPAFFERLAPVQAAFWRELAARVVAEATVDCVRAAFGDEPALQQRLVTQLRLVRESGAYILTPHLDMDQKAVVMVVYLAADDTQSALGTTLYERKESGNFTAHTTLAYRPNCASAMLRRPDAWHGGDWSGLTGERNTLHLYFVPEPA